MQGDRCLSTACHTLYNNVLIRQIPDDGILLLLDGSNDITENRILILGQIFILMAPFFPAIPNPVLSLYQTRKRKKIKKMGFFHFFSGMISEKLFRETDFGG